MGASNRDQLRTNREGNAGKREDETRAQKPDLPFALEINWVPNCNWRPHQAR